MPHSSIPSFRRRAARASLAKACVQHVLPAGVLAVLAAGCVVPRALAPSKAYWPTRWFREGFANYAGYHAARFVRDQATPWETASGPILWRGLAMQPFSKLAKVRTDLFRWNQRSSAAQDDDYYEAALGLFLLIEHHRGAAAVRSIIEALPSLKRPDGPAILKLFREKTGLDLRRTLRDFAFPDPGLTLEPNAAGQLEIRNVRAPGPAAELDLRPGDVLQAINGQPVGDLLEYERRLLLAGESCTPLTLTLTRNGQLETRVLPPAFRHGKGKDSKR